MSTDLKQKLSALSDEQRRLLAQRLSRRGRGPVGPTIARRAPGLQRFPLSFAQQRLWFLNQVSPLNLAFAVTEINRLSGDLNVDALEASLNEIVRRHEVLRTTFGVTDGEPYQSIMPSLDFKVEVEDLRSVPVSEREQRLVGRVSEAQARPWMLETGPLVRAHVWHVADDDHVVLVLLHHIISDGWSKNILVRELATLFQAFSEGKPSPLAELPVQYGDFAVWEHEWVAGAEARAALEYWKSHLAGAPVLQLPSEQPNRPATSTSGFHRRTWIPSALKQALNSLSHAESATMFMTLFAAFAALLSRYSGQDDIVVGSPFANRRLPEIENLIGCFMNPLPLRVDLSGNPTFRQLLGRVRAVAVGAYAHQGAPFDLLVRTTERRRDAGASPLFQVLFLLQNFDWQELQLSGSELGRRSVVVSEDLQITDAEVVGDLAYPVGLEIVDVGERLFASFEYAPEYASVFAHAPGHFRALLEAVVANPDAAIRDISILTAAERDTLVYDWNRNRAANYTIQPVHRLFEAQVLATPERVAVVSGGERLTYAELNARANQLARHLLRNGAGAERAVGIVLERTVDAVVAVLAVLKAGSAYVPLDPNYPSERQTFVLRDARVRVIVTEQRLFDRFPELFPQADDTAPTRVCLDTDRAAIAACGSDNLAIATAVDSLAYVIYTSGSTGKPKGTMIPHAALANAYFAWREAYGLADINAHLQMASISFDVFSGDLVRALCSGGKLVLTPHEHLFNPAELYRLMREERVDCAEFVPAIVRDLVKFVTASGQSLDFMRLMVVGSDTWSATEYAALQELCGPGTRVINSYGVSEATIDSSFFEGAVVTAGADGVLPIGRAFANTEIYLLDSTLQLAPIGVAGELCIGGPGLARGYLNRADLTADKFVPHPLAARPGERLYRTGDLARFLPGGNIELLGRIDDQVKLRGFRIEVGEIEAVLKQHECVEHAIVVLREDVPGDKRLVGYVVAARGHAMSAPDLRRFVREKLPEYMVPSVVAEIGEVPLLPNGKVNRRALPAPEPQRQSDEPFVAPVTESERIIADVWKELLNLQAVGIHDNFFDLGGHSLLVIQLHSRLSKRLGGTLTVLDLFVHPTIHALASHVADARLDDHAGLADLNVARDRAARQRDANRRRRLATEATEVAR